MNDGDAHMQKNSLYYIIISLIKAWISIGRNAIERLNREIGRAFWCKLAQINLAYQGNSKFV